MITIPKQRTRTSTAQHWHAKFLGLLPTIRRQARIAFRHEPSERREEMTAEVVANCWVAFVRLMKRGLDDAIYPTPLAQYAIKQVRAGRKVGGKLNCRDVSSGHCQVTKGVRVGRLDHYDANTDEWKEVLVEDRRAGPAETACCRIDFADWFRSLSRRNRRIASTLAQGETTTSVARQFGVSPGRISQIRRELREAWDRFHGEILNGGAAEAPT
jgi:hypothetical protein